MTTEMNDRTEIDTSNPDVPTDPWDLVSTPRPGRALNGRVQDPWAGTETRPWDPLPGESGIDYQRFGYYRRLRLVKANKRSIANAYINERRDKFGPGFDQRGVKNPKVSMAPPSWHRARERYHWDERCRLWDLHNETQLLLAEERELEIARQERRDALHTLLAKCVDAIPSLDATKFTLAQVSRAVQVSVQELRKEYGQDSTPGTIQLEALISTIPADFRSEVIIALRARTGGSGTQVTTEHRLAPKIVEGESEVLPK